MGYYKTVTRLKLNYNNVYVILVLTCVSAVVGRRSTTTHGEFLTRTTLTAANVTTSPSTSERTGVKSTHPGLLFNTYVNMRCFSVYFLSFGNYTNGL